MEAIVLAGGFGTRLREAVPDLPKPMAPIGGRPFLEILLASLATSGVTRIILSLGYKADVISSYFGLRFAGMEIEYVTELAPLGTGGAVRLAMTRCLSDHTFVLNGDTFLDLEMLQVDSLWKARKRPIIVGCTVPDTTRYGRLLVSDGCVNGFAEGVTGPGLINAGCYMLGSRQLDDWPVNTYFSLERDYLIPFVERERVGFFETRGLFIDIGIPEDFMRAQTIFAERR